MNAVFRAITFDLDDTLWPFAPIGARLEQALHTWFLTHSPKTAEMFPVEKMRELRATVHAENPQLQHDLPTLRRMTIASALQQSGSAPELSSVFDDTFEQLRNQVEFYADSLDALQRLRSAGYRLAAISNGNACLHRIGIAEVFEFCLSAHEFGYAKPNPKIFMEASQRLQLAPAEIMHIGDHVDLDVYGALAAGMQAAWLNRDYHPRPEQLPDTVISYADLTTFADWATRLIASPFSLTD